MTQDQHTHISPGELLETLQRHPRLANFNLAAYCPKDSLAAEQMAQKELSKAIGHNSLCGPGCLNDHQDAARQALADGQPKVFRCTSGLWNFAVPFPPDYAESCCLLAGGVRDQAPDLALLEKISNSTNADGESLLERLEALPAATRQQIEETATEIHQAMPSILGNSIYALALNKTTHRLSALAEVSTAIDCAETVEELAELLNETLLILFDLPRIALVLESDNGHGYRLQAALGLPRDQGQPAPRRIAEFINENPAGKPVALGDEALALFPQIVVNRTLIVPLVSAGQHLGLLALFDADLPTRDLLLIELLSGRAAARLLHLRQQREYRLKNDFSNQLLTMISALSVIESRQGLYQKLVDLAADLLQATRGSLMLVDEIGGTLNIVAAKGMNQALARSMSVPCGEGIAGKVARSGFPLLVNDIEKDRRTAIANRPRFKNKSFISLPFKVKDRTIGVLNFSDKEGQPTFTQTDLDLLSSFTAHAALMIERAASIERTSALEELSVTDPLTGIYNRRLLEERLQEELNRSSRQKQEFTALGRGQCPQTGCSTPQMFCAGHGYRHPLWR